MFRATCPDAEDDMQELMTKEIAETVPRLYGQDGAGDPIPLEHSPQTGKIEGPDPGGVPESGPRGLVAI